MKKLLLISFVISFLFACGQQNKESVQLADENEPLTPQFENLRAEYESLCDQVIRIDTNILLGEDNYEFHIYHECDFDSMIIPARYHLGENPQDFIAHGFTSKVTVFSQGDSEAVQWDIDKEFFADQLTGELQNFGALLYPTVESFDPDLNSLIVRYSISIPATDVGIPVRMSIDIKGEIKVLDAN